MPQITFAADLRAKGFSEPSAKPVFVGKRKTVSEVIVIAISAICNSKEPTSEEKGRSDLHHPFRRNE